MAPIYQFLLAAACCFSSVNSHMIMSSPAPFDNTPPDSSPLLSSGSNFPCKNDGTAGFYKTTNRTSMAIGSQQTLEFKPGGAKHGGSCQLAITKDLAPTASSSWQVILSIEGGCLTSDQNNPTYNYKIPSEIAPGDAVLTWTWISKNAGQGEYYMNCAPITITGGTSKRDLVERDELPELFVANLAGINDCKAGVIGGASGVDVIYPNPGSAVQGTPSPGGKPVGTNCTPKVNNAGASSGTTNSSTDSIGGASTSATISTSTIASSSIAPVSVSSTATVTTTVLSSAPPPASSTNEPSSTLPDGQIGKTGTPMITLAQPTLLSTLASLPSTTASPLSVNSSTTIAGPQSSTQSTMHSNSTITIPSSTFTTRTTAAGSLTTGTATAGQFSGPCTQEGQWNCLQTSSGLAWQRCASGSWTGMVPLQSGQACKLGLSDGLWNRALNGRVGGKRIAAVRK